MCLNYMNMNVGIINRYLTLFSSQLLKHVYIVYIMKKYQFAVWGPTCFQIIDLMERTCLIHIHIRKPRCSASVLCTSLC